jgi:adenylate kinase
MRLVLLGPPGAGKGTQATHLSRAYGIPHVSTGDIFRANLRDETPIGLRAREYMDAGELVPDEVVNDMVADRLEADDTSGGFLFDGYPRTVGQAEWFEKLLADRSTPLDVVLKFEVDEDELVERLTGRRVHGPTGDIYHLRFNPPPDHVDPDELVQRDDDTEDVVRKRLEVYRRDTEPLEHFYWERGLLRPVAAVGEVSEVTERALAVLREHEEPRGA